MNELKLTLYERDGVPDNARWEASTGIHHALGATPGEAVERLVSQIDAARPFAGCRFDNTKHNYGVTFNGAVSGTLRAERHTLSMRGAEGGASTTVYDDTLPFAPMDKIGKVEEPET